MDHNEIQFCEEHGHCICGNDCMVPVARRVQLEIVTEHDITPVQFTNVPMNRVHAAIAVLNGDGDGEETELTEEGAHLLAINQAAQQRDLFRKFYPPYAAPGTKEFTTEELFPRVDNPLNVDGDPCGICRECGAVVSNPVKHVTWHNKTLP